MKKFYAILSLLFVYIFLVSCGSVFADGDYYDYSNPTTISIGGDGTVIFGDGNTMGQPIEISESDGDMVEIDVDAEVQAVGIIKIDDVPLYIMITNLKSTTQGILLEIGNRTWLYNVPGSGGIILSVYDMIEYGPPVAAKVTAAPGAVLLERVQP